MCFWSELKFNEEVGVLKNALWMKKYFSCMEDIGMASIGSSRDNSLESALRVYVRIPCFLWSIERILYVADRFCRYLLNNTIYVAFVWEGRELSIAVACY